VENLMEHITEIQATIEGLTISGGEPLQQPGALLRLLAGLRTCTSLSVILFTGYSLQEARSVPHGADVLHNVDVVIAGRFVRELRTAEGLRGSSNQIVHLVTNRYCLCDLEQTPMGEISIDGGGVISVSGINPPRVVETVSGGEFQVDSCGESSSGGTGVSPVNDGQDETVSKLGVH
jgi:anaerobic ribonucleoside-triphosphate reductase activating protein